MKSLIVYDSMYGNTAEVAGAIAGAMKAKRVRVGDFRKDMLTGVTLLIVGSPVHGGRPTEAIQEFLQNIPANTLKNTRVAAFDTRFLENDQGFWLRLLIKTVGYAAPRIAESLEAKGGQTAAAPEGFIVEGKEGPLRKGELARAAEWAEVILKKSIK